MTGRHCLRRILPASRVGVDFFVNTDFYVVVADVSIVTGSYALGWEGIVSPLRLLQDLITA